MLGLRCTAIAAADRTGSADGEQIHRVVGRPTPALQGRWRGVDKATDANWNDRPPSHGVVLIASRAWMFAQGTKRSSRTTAAAIQAK